MFFKKPKQGIDILPPPFPFPKLEISEAEESETQIGKEIEKDVKKIKPGIKEKIKLKAEKEKTKIDKELEQLEKRIVMPIEEKRKTKEKFLKPFLKKKLMPEIKELPEIKPFKDRIFFKRPKLKEPIEIEKPIEMALAEQEISRAIEDLKKPKSLFKLSKPEKEKQKIKLPEMAEELQKLPPVEIEEQKDEVIAIKHKIHDARNALMDFDLIKAKVIYIKIMNMYNNLSPEKQARVYEDIMDLYDERKNAESLRLKAA